MRIDVENGVLVTDGPIPGCYGDSCANTARYELLQLAIHGRETTNLGAFVTSKGIIRHPLSPWREDDTSSDQTFPLMMALIARGTYVRDADALLTSVSLRTGNGDISSPGLLAVTRRLYGILALINAISALVLMLPFRYNDEKRRFERTSAGENSGDFLNWFAVVNFLYLMDKPRLCRLSRLFVSKEDVRAKIHFYYRGEVNCDWILNAYDKAIDKVFSK